MLIVSVALSVRAPSKTDTPVTVVTSPVPSGVPAGTVTRTRMRMKPSLARKPESGIASASLVYWLGDSTGVLLITPLALAVPALALNRAQSRVGEFAVFGLSLTLACLIIFGDLSLIPIRMHVLAFAVWPFVMWAAIRLGVIGVAFSTLVVAVIATIETALGLGPFSQNTTFTNVAKELG